ncbi:MAG: DUF1385 domain-containing protein [Firmicutes bacterium]|nr:DUF1385 domain-containing protein [Bacillota bacterium]
MMRGPKTRSIAVRKPDNSIIIDNKKLKSITEKFPFLKWPGVRGVVALFESLIMGMEALSYSANQAAEAEDEEITKKEMIFTILFAFGLAILLFVVLPTAATHWAAAKVENPFWNNIIEGIIRIGVFLAYVVAISRMKDIQRVFQYHGAEHKVINAYEAGEPLEPSRIQRYSSLHPRCGTSFLLIVMVVSIFIFATLGHNEDMILRILSRVLLLPVVAGISYELLKLSSKYTQNWFCKVAIAPGMWLQKLTTREPDDSQVEVAVSALQSVLEEGEDHAR